MEYEKSPIQSKTILANSAVLGLIPLFEAFGIKVDQNVLLAVIPLVNIFLRFVTSGFKMEIAHSSKYICEE